MSDLNTNGIQLPLLAPGATVPPATQPGFARLVVRGNTLYAVDSAGQEVVVAKNIDLTAGEYTLSNNTPTTPTANNVVIFSQKYGGEDLVVSKDSYGKTRPIQEALFTNGTKFLTFNATTWTGHNMPTPTVIGRPALQVPTVTNAYTKSRRLRYTTAANAAPVVSSAGIYLNAANLCWMNPTDPEGWHIVIPFAIGDDVAATRGFVGLSTTIAAPADAQPSTMLNQIGVGWDSADTTLRIMHGGTVAQTPIDIGIPITTNRLYELHLFRPPGSNGTVVGWEVIEHVNNQRVAGTINAVSGTALPNAGLAYRAYRQNTTADAITMELLPIHLKTTSP